MVFVYLVSIVLANLMVGWFGPGITVVNAFVLIGLDITSRDRLHDQWKGNGLVWKMGLLIAVGGIISWILNQGLAQIAIASSMSFLFSALVDTVIYQLAHKKRWIIRSNISNIGSGAVDSILFPLLAFGWPPMVLIMLGQFAAKLLGGFLWSIVLNKRSAKESVGKPQITMTRNQ